MYVCLFLSLFYFAALQVCVWMWGRVFFFTLIWLLISIFSFTFISSISRLSSHLTYFIYTFLFFISSLSVSSLLHFSDVVSVRKEDTAIRDFVFPYSACSGRLITIEKVTVHQCKYKHALCVLLLFYCIIFYSIVITFILS